MPTWLAAVLIALAALLVLLALGGALAVARRRERERASFATQVDEANRALAAAHAADRGWDPAAVSDAARRAFEAERPGHPVRDMVLIQVVDPPGTDEDRAVFRFETEDGAAHQLTLGRRGDEWRLERID